MLIKSIYYGSKNVIRIWLGGRIVWPLNGGEISMELFNAMFSNGTYSMTTTTIDRLIIDTGSVSTSSISPSTIEPTRLYCENDIYSDRVSEFIVSISEAHNLVVDIDSNTEELIAEHIMAAAQLAIETDNVTVDETKIEVCSSAILDHFEDCVDRDEVNMPMVPQAVLLCDQEDMASTDELFAGSFDSVNLETSEDNSNSEELSAGCADLAFMSTDSADRTSSEIRVIPFRVDGVVEIDSEAKSETDETWTVETDDPVSIRSHLRIVTTIEASLLVSDVSHVAIDERSKTSIIAVLNYEGEEPEDDWLDPIQNESNLYIRQVYEDPGQEGTNLEIAGVFFPPEQDGTNLYIISSASLGGE